MADEKDLLAAFKIICRKCGSENVVVNIEPMQDYGGETGASGGWIDFGCNDCQKNDVMVCT